MFWICGGECRELDELGRLGRSRTWLSRGDSLAFSEHAEGEWTKKTLVQVCGGVLESREGAWLSRGKRGKVGKTGPILQISIWQHRMVDVAPLAY